MFSGMIRGSKRPSESEHKEQSIRTHESSLEREKMPSAPKNFASLKAEFISDSASTALPPESATANATPLAAAVRDLFE